MISEPVPETDLARVLGVTEEAVSICRESDFIDLHIDTFIPMRLAGYAPELRHDSPVTRGYFFGHLDLPRMRDAGLSGAMWSITTNPFRGKRRRAEVYLQNVETFRDWARTNEQSVAMVRNASQYQQAVEAGKHAIFLAVQGGNAFEHLVGQEEALADGDLLRVTLLHLTNSKYGASSAPVSWLKPNKKLSPLGKRLVEQLNAGRVFVDLAHIHPDTFWSALEVHDPTLPPLVTHTGVSAVHKHWRNIDDAQIRAIADRGGVIGVIFHEHFLRPRRMARGSVECVFAHLEHLVDVGGEGCAAIGSDYDGAIVPPAPLRSGNSYPRLVQFMRDAGWSLSRVEKVLGRNFLRALEALRG